MRHLPNLLTFLRLALTPVLLYFILVETAIANQILRVVVVVLIYVVATLTDYFDGYFSRKYHVTSRFGEFLDPLADKILIIAVFLAFIYLDFVPVPAVLVILIMIREVLITGIRIWATAKRQVMKTEKHGKIKTVVQIVSQSIVWFVMLVYAIVTVMPEFKNWLVLHPGTSAMKGVHTFLLETRYFPGWITATLHWMPASFIAVASAITLYSGYAYLRGNAGLLFGTQKKSPAKKKKSPAARKKTGRKRR